MTDETFTFKNKRSIGKVEDLKFESIGKHIERLQLKIFILKYCKIIISVAFHLKILFLVCAVLLCI